MFNVITLCVQCHHAACSMSSRCVFNVITPRVQCHHAGSGSALAPPLTCVMCCRELTSTRATVGMKIWNIIIIFIFFAQKLFWCLHKITVEPLMLHGLFYQSPCYVSGHGNFSVVLLSMEGLRVLRFKQKHLNLCSDNERRSYGFGTTSGWVIYDNIFIFGQTNPLKEFCVRTKDFPTYFRSS